jgi:ABC-2 type transport system permease protein
VKALAIAGSNLRRVLRWRANVFFLFVLPMLIILLLGAAFGSEAARIGVASEGSGVLGRELVAELERRDGLEVERYGSERSLRDAVERGTVSGGLAVPPDYDVRLRSGSAASLRWFARPDSLAEELRLAVGGAVGEQAAVLRAARFLEAERGADPAEALVRARAAAAAVPPLEVRVRTAEGEDYPTGRGRFDEGASTQLLLFVFLTSLNGAIWLIESRRLGVTRRMLVTPTPVSSILAGEALGRFGIAVVQALIIVVGSAVLFGVGWGDPLAAGMLVLAFCLVGTGAGMLLGAVAGSEEQAGPLALLLGLTLAALGGSMVPLEVFPDAMRTAARLTPHAWANEAFSELLRHEGTLADVLPQLGVLLGIAAALLLAATWRLRRVVTA